MLRLRQKRCRTANRGVMSGLASVLGIAVLIAAVLAVHMLRSILAVPIPARVQLRPVADMQPPATLAPLFAERDRELDALGFAPLTWVLLNNEPDSVPGPRLMRLYRSSDLRSLAQVIAPFSVEEPLHCRVHFVSDGINGKLLFTAAPMLEVLPSEPELAICQTADHADLGEQWRAHQALLTRAGGGLTWGHATAAIQRLIAYEQSVNQRMLYRGVVRTHADGSLRLSLNRALAVLRTALQRPASAPVPASEVPARRAALYWRNWQQISRHAPRNPVQLSLFLVSAAVFAIAGAWIWDVRFALILLAIIALHEAGHWWAMRCLGYRNLQMLMLPMVGGVTIGHEQRPSARDRAWVSLMGPLPGILLGFGLFTLGVDAGDGWLYLTAWLLLLVNLFNLLPLLPLDGGHLLHALLPERAVTVRIVFDALAIGAMLALAWWLNVWWLGLLALVPASALRNGSRDRRRLEALRQARERAPVSNENTEIEQAFTVLRDDPEAPETLQAQAPVIDQMLTHVRMQAMGRGSAAILSLIWLGCFAITLSLPQVRAVAAIALAPDHPLADLERALDDLRATASALSDEELVERLLAEQPSVGAGSGRSTDRRDLDAAQRRIGSELHPAYRALMRSVHAEGLRSALSLAEPSKLDRLGRRRDCLAWLDAEADWPGFSTGAPVQFTIYDADPSAIDSRNRRFDRDDLASWLVVGDCGGGADHLALIEPDRPEWPLWRFSIYEPVASRQHRLRDTLEEGYVNQRFTELLQGPSRPE